MERSCRWLSWKRLSRGKCGRVRAKILLGRPLNARDVSKSFDLPTHLPSEQFVIGTNAPGPTAARLFVSEPVYAPASPVDGKETYKMPPPRPTSLPFIWPLHRGKNELKLFHQNFTSYLHFIDSRPPTIDAHTCQWFR